MKVFTENGGLDLEDLVLDNSKGDAEAQYELGLCFWIDNNDDKAEKCFLKVAAQGHQKARIALYNYYIGIYKKKGYSHE